MPAIMQYEKQPDEKKSSKHAQQHRQPISKLQCKIRRSPQADERYNRHNDFDDPALNIWLSVPNQLLSPTLRISRQGNLTRHANLTN